MKHASIKWLRTLFLILGLATGAAGDSVLAVENTPSIPVTVRSSDNASDSSSTEESTDDAWHQMRMMRDRMHRLFDGWMEPDGFGWGPSLGGDADVMEDDKQVTVIMDLPGFTKDEIHLQVVADTLEISGERRSTDEEEKARGNVRYHSRSRVMGRIHYTVRLPAKIKTSEVTAQYRDGVLRVVLPKSGESQGVVIPVQ